ncbi:14516_t:CDS:1 [Funneliformis caledonium]|uniref:14516_t:CDS:1 n=1 Tax=Funneliformis caledonium TaxID=1117310 RepID=A0A9N9D110_9GLOM|nr:14516_t:CDS:1 [Funneliformis caledonium]
MSEKTSIILFGPTGQGKSSIANMLIQGDISHKENKFVVNYGVVDASVSIQCNDTMDSVSTYIERKTNDEFIVYDTIRVDEVCSGKVSHKKTVKEIRDYFITRQFPLNYIAFVKKKGRFTEEDLKMFNLFKEIFEGNEKNFIIIITNSSQKWVEQNSESLKKNFREDYPIIPVDFPCSEEEDDDAVIQRNKIVESQSLQNLTYKLSELKYKDTKLQDRSPNQTTENNIARVTYIMPVAGTAYQLISSGIYYGIGKTKLAKERLNNGIIRGFFDIVMFLFLRHLRRLVHL